MCLCSFSIFILTCIIFGERVDVLDGPSAKATMSISVSFQSIRVRCRRRRYVCRFHQIIFGGRSPNRWTQLRPTRSTGPDRPNSPDWLKIFQIVAHSHFCIQVGFSLMIDMFASQRDKSLPYSIVH